ncbi:MAG: fimbrillin family protein, partial [Segatella copri]|nr:fimbrillin family protein [Segatella copri]
MMKKTYKSSLLALSVLASFTSCSESESLQQANLSKDKITFHATLDNSWKPLSPASSSRAAIAAATEKGPIVVPTPFGKPLYLHSVVQETADLQQAAAITRGAMQDGTTLDNTYYNNSFGVTAISTNNGTNTALFTNQKASKNNEDIWEIEDKTNSRWPFDALVSFHAYAPFNDATDGMWSVTTDADNVKTKISYTAKADAITSQPDLIVATNAESRSYTSEDKAVELNFSHALTAVNFAISQDLTEIFHMGATDGSKLKSITLSGIPNEGTCELAAKEGSPKTALQNWTLATDANGKKTGSYTFNLENKNITIGESYALTSNDDKNILMMIPQDLNGTRAQLTFVLDIKGKGDQTFTFDLSNQTWLPGTSVTYKLSASAINHLENAEVKFPESWNGVNYPKTGFAEGESIGLYVVNSNNIIEEANLKLTRDQDGKWMPENNNTKFLKLKGYKYFAYYPYNAADPTVDVKKDNADEFFKDKITNWNPVKDQNTEDVLLSQDLQVGEGVIDNDASTLTFNMAHSMG